MTFAQWQATMSLDAQSMETAPNLDLDFHLNASSPAIDAAMPSATASDYDFNPRTGTPDIGADEYGAGTNLVTPPLPGVIGTGSPNTLQSVSIPTLGLEVAVWPNPATSRIHVQVTNERILTIVLSNAAGQKVLQTHATTFSVAHLPAGSYFLNVSTLHGMGSLKVQIVH